MYELFEKKLGIVLNPNDYEIINRLYETYSEEEINQALNIAYQNNAKKVQYVVKILYNLKSENTPSWFNSKIKKEPLSDDELEECIECLKEFHTTDFDKWANNQRKYNERIKREK